jgi:hypothetical protein
MATIKTPTTYLPGILFKTVDADGEIKTLTVGKKYVLLDKADFPELEDADNTDIRRVLFGLMEGLHNKHTAADVGTGNTKPTKWIPSRSVSINSLTNVVTRTYTHRFETVATGEEVVAEA